MPATTHDIITEDAEYLRHGGTGLMLRLYRPRGDGPFPIIVDLHGGAWTSGDLGDCQARDQALARAGFVAAALNFRHAGDGYPTSLVDINYAIRWLKVRASDLRSRADLVGITGQSSGGHLAMLTAMRPHDPQYAAIPLSPGAPPVDATVRCVAMLWPVINPLSRYRNAIRQHASADPPAWSNNMKERHDLYWRTEAAMEEGNPMLALERGERVQTPPALWIQGRPDPVHDYHDPNSEVPGNEPERFVTNYRRAGGTIELRPVEQALRETASIEPLIAFLRAAMPVPH
ncbi:MAG TPA: alpha/beta hydrolase [Acetobacteraceae bacterium]|nr:alpha/beta hydrolase [Acetobacteraceae bacterium]